MYHAAGVNAFCVPDPRPMFEVNVAGSRAVVIAAAAAGVATGGVHVVGGDPRRWRGIGRRGFARRFLSNYARSKYEAEQGGHGGRGRTGLDVVYVNPASVQGPGRTSGTARLLIGYLNGKLPAAVDGPLNVIDIADCTRGHLLAEERRRRPVERYLLCGASMTLRSGLALLSRLTGLEDPPRFLPPRLALAAAACIEAVARARRKHTRFCREMVRTLIEGAPYDGAQAARDLGLAYTPIETTMRRTISWYLDAGADPPVASFHRRASRHRHHRLSGRQRAGGVAIACGGRATGAACRRNPGRRSVKRFSVPCTRRSMLARCSTMMPRAAPSVKNTSAHEPPKTRTRGGSASDAVIDATDVYRVASSTIHQSTAMTTEASGAITRRHPQCGNDLAAAPEAEEQGPPVPDQRADPGNHRTGGAAHREADRRSRRSLADIQQRDNEEHLETGVPPDIRGAGPPAPDLADVLPGEEPREPVSPWETPEHVSGHPQKHNGQEAHLAILDAIPETRL